MPLSLFRPRVGLRHQPGSSGVRAVRTALGGRWHAAVQGLPRPYWWLWLGTLVNRFGTFVEPFLVLYLTRQRHLSVTAAGAVLTVFGAGSVFSQPLAGSLADRFGRRATLVFTLVGAAVCVLLLGVAPAGPLLFGAAFAYGLTVDGYRPAANAAVADLVPPAERPRAFGLLFWAVNLGFSAATATAGLLAEHGFLLLFAGDAVTTLAFAGLVLRNVPETRPHHVGTGGAGWGIVLRDRLLLTFTALIVLYSCVYLQVFVTLPLAMRDSGLPTSAFGLVAALNGVLIVLISPFATSWLARQRRGPTYAAGQALVGLGFGLTGFASNALGYALTVVVWTLGEIVVSAFFGAIVADLAPAHLRGRYNGVVGLGFGVSGALAPLLGTRVYSGLGPGWLWSGCALLGVLVAAGTVAIDAPITRRARAIAVAEAAPSANAHPVLATRAHVACTAPD